MMKAVVLEEFGSAPVLRSVERPSPGPGEVVVRVAASGVNPRHGEILRAVAALVDDGKLTPVLDTEPYDLTTAAAAHQAVTTGTARGKVVVRVGPGQE